MLVEDVLEFSRGGEDVAREPLSVASLLDEAAAPSRLNAEAKGLPLTLIVEASARGGFSGDRRRLRHPRQSRDRSRLRRDRSAHQAGVTGMRLGFNFWLGATLTTLVILVAAKVFNGPLGAENMVSTIAGLAKDDRHRTAELLCGFPPVLVGIRPTSPLFHFLAHIQEEVHRFAVSFHRQKRSKAFIHSELEQIEGVGDKTVQTLLRHFRTVEKVRAANIEELSALVGAAKAKKIRAFFEK